MRWVSGYRQPGAIQRRRQQHHTTEEILDALIDAAVDEPPPLDMLLEDVQNLQREKWDWVLPDGLLRKAHASHYLDLDEALAWAKTLAFDDKGGNVASGQGPAPN